MNGGEITVIVVAALITTAVILALLYRYLGKVYGPGRAADSELRELRQQVAQLTSRLEQVGRVEPRLRVLEQIVTDGGAQTAAQIEALRDQARIENGDEVQ